MQTERAPIPVLSPLEDRWLTADETANYMGVQVDTLSKWRLRGMGPPYSAALRRDPRYRLSDLIEYMATKMATNTREAGTIRREHQAFESQRYTMRRTIRPGRAA